MRILYILNDAGGGATMSALQLIESFPPDQVSAFVICHPRGQAQVMSKIARLSQGHRYVFMPWWVVPGGIPLWLRPFVWAKRMLHSVARLKSTLTVAYCIRRWRIDVVHTNTLVQVEGALGAWLMGVPHVWHIRELAGPGTRYHFRLPFAAVKRLVHGLSARVVANSNAARACIMLDSQREKSLVLSNAVTVTDFAGENVRARGQAMRHRWGCGGDEILVGMCGAVGAPSKCHDRFIEMAALMHRQNAGLRFVICGSVPAQGTSGESYYQRLQALVTKAGLDDALTFAGHVDDIPAMMNAFDVMVHPSPNEGFGRVVIEAMAAGKPVIGVRAGGVAEIVVDAVTGFLVEPARPDLLADRALELARAPEMRNTMGAAGRMRAEQCYSLDVLSRRVVSLYRQVIDEREGLPHHAVAAEDAEHR